MDNEFKEILYDNVDVIASFVKKRRSKRLIKAIVFLVMCIADLVYILVFQPVGWNTLIGFINTLVVVGLSVVGVWNMYDYATLVNWNVNWAKYGKIETKSRTKLSVKTNFRIDTGYYLYVSHGTEVSECLCESSVYWRVWPKDEVLIFSIGDGKVYATLADRELS